MTKLTVVALCALAMAAPLDRATAQVAGESKIGVTAQELRTVVLGWSAKHKLMDKPVYNETNDKIGEVEDVIVSPDGKVSWAIVAVGGFLEMGEKQVAIPIRQLRISNDRYVLRGGTKDALKAMPEFKYAKS